MWLSVIVLQEAAYIKIHAEIPDVLTNSAQPVNNKAYNNWENYLVAFLGQGVYCGMYENYSEALL